MLPRKCNNNGNSKYLFRNTINLITLIAFVLHKNIKQIKNESELKLGHTLKKTFFNPGWKRFYRTLCQKWPKMVVVGQKSIVFYLNLFFSSSVNGSNHVYSRYELSQKIIFFCNLKCYIIA